MKNMPNNYTLVVLAAGIGSRFKGGIKQLMPIIVIFIASMVFRIAISTIKAMSSGKAESKRVKINSKPEPPPLVGLSMKKVRIKGTMAHTERRV